LPGKTHFLKRFVIEPLQKSSREFFLISTWFIMEAREENLSFLKIFFDTYPLGRIKGFFEGTKSLASKKAEY